jgi:hypothetical protein
MTESEWLTGIDPNPMLKFLQYRRVSERKRRLFAASCCRRVWHLLLDERSRQAVEFAECCDDWSAVDRQRVGMCEAAFQAARDLSARYRQLTDGDISSSHPLYREAWMYLRAANAATLTVHDNAWDSAVAASDWAAVATGLEMGGDADRYHRDGQAERQHQAGIVRDIFGNPFRPVTVDPSWLTADVRLLAAGIYEEKAFDRMPILADALQDAGCTNDDILSHCRSEGPHVRGCWVVDLVLGKQ